MNQLLIIAHPKKDSFTQQLKSELVDRFYEQGHEVKVRDLYDLKFNPVLSAQELKFNKEGQFMADVVVEQNYIQWADEITILYPLWWDAFPAILKGYIDRVFTNGFAFRMNGKGPEGMLTEKRVRLITSAGMDEKSLRLSNVYEGLKTTQDKGVFEFCGMQVIDHMYVTRVTSLNEEEKEKTMEKLLKEIFEKERVDRL
ncbi:MAG: NAD(P)H-dependent oxidoreductase [Bacteroidetes bacterium]|nr:NAD(P)H-dependent oxidoreductase [Bacteroidota bacterium]